MRKNVMRTNIVIDDELMAEAIRLSKLPSKRAAVEAGFRLVVAVNRQAAIRKLKGTVRWEGNLEEQRLSRVAERGV
jgi:Arc/MetJ family transcription regulator